MIRSAHKSIVAAVIASALTLGSAHASSVAKFRVIGAEANEDGKTIKVKIAWDYNSGDSMGFSGKGVKFHVHTKMPAYGDAARGVSVGTVDMVNGTGIASFDVDIAAVGAKEGDALVLTGQWPNNHQWGMDDGGRTGGTFKVPAAKPAKPTTPPAANRSGAIARGRPSLRSPAQTSARPGIAPAGPGTRRLTPGPARPRH